MEEKKTPNKVLPIIGIIFALVFLGLGGAVAGQMLFGGYNIDWSGLFPALVFVALGIYILIKCISSLLKKEPKEKTEEDGEEKPFNIKKLMLWLFLIGLFCLIFGCLDGNALLIVLGVFLVGFMTAIFIAMTRDAAIAKKHGDGAQEIFEKKNKRGPLVVVLILVIALTAAGFLMSKFAPEEEETEGYCESCDTEYTNRDDVRSIAKTGLCEDCYENFQYFQQFIEE